MAFVHYMVAVAAPSSTTTTISSTRLSPPSTTLTSHSSSSSLSFWTKARKLSLLSTTFCKFGHKKASMPQKVSSIKLISLWYSISFYASEARANLPESEAITAADAFTQFKHILLPITDKNPYLSEGTRQAAATGAALAKKYEADITVVVIDEDPKESAPEHDTKLSSIRWHLSEGGFQEFRLLERLGEGKKPTSIIGEVADDLNLDLVVMSMEAIHSKHVDANLLAEFIPCPVLLLPL